MVSGMGSVWAGSSGARLGLSGGVEKVWGVSAASGTEVIHRGGGVGGGVGGGGIRLGISVALVSWYGGVSSEQGMGAARGQRNLAHTGLNPHLVCGEIRCRVPSGWAKS